MASSATRVQSCLFPATGRSRSGQKRPLSVRVELQHPELVRQLLAEDHDGSSLSAAVRATWALLLRIYTGLDEVCFGLGEVGGASLSSITGNSATGDDCEAVAVLRIDDEMPFGQLIASSRNDGSIVTSPKEHQLQYNTSVLIRFGPQAGRNQLPHKPTAMSDMVFSPLRCLLNTC